MVTHPMTDTKARKAAEIADACRSAMVASCTCHTKTPDPAYHKETCPYRVLSECEVYLRALPAVAKPMPEGEENSPAVQNAILRFHFADWALNKDKAGDWFDNADDLHLAEGELAWEAFKAGVEYARADAALKCDSPKVSE